MAGAAEPVYDVVVYGGTSGGVVAAVQAARMGKSVVLIEPGRHLGGLTSGGLGATDIGNKQAIGGAVARVLSPRPSPLSTTPTPGSRRRATSTRPASDGRSIDEDTMWSFEPHVAEAVFRDMLREAKRAGRPRTSGSTWSAASARTAQRIAAIVMESGRVFAGRMFIDATYEGDLMAKAGVSLHRRPRGERPVRRDAQRRADGAGQAPPVRQAGRSVRRAGRSGERPAAGRAGRSRRARTAQGDRRVQAYCFRMCLTDVPENRVALAQARGLRPAAVRAAAAQLRGGRPARALEPDGHAQPQDRHEQQLRRLDRQHRHELRLSRRRLRHARADRRASTRRISRA